MPKNIQMNILDSDGQYDVLYPETNAEQVLNLDTTVSQSELMLSDLTKNLMGLDSTSVPDTAFMALIFGVGNKGAILTVKTPKGNVVSGVTINGVTNLEGKSAVTDNNGMVAVIVDSDTLNLSITSPFIDIKDYSTAISMTSQPMISYIDLTLEYNDVNKKIYESSQSNLKFSPDVVNYDVCAVGGGGSGSGGENWGTYDKGIPGGGGAGGDIINLLNQQAVENDVFNITVGSGGARATTYTQPGKQGGMSSAFKNNQNLLQANGGQGCPSGDLRVSYTAIGHNNGGNGGASGFASGYDVINGRRGGSGGYLFNDTNEMQVCGGGSGGQVGNNTYITGGLPFGGNSVYMTRINSAYQQIYGDGKGIGGGGGGAGATNSGGTTDSGAGHAGCVAFRWRYE